MNTTNTAAQVEVLKSINILKGDSIKDFAALLLDNGMQVFTKIYNSGSSTYIYFSDGVNIGYAQEGRWGGVRISTVHFPTKDIGTGFSLQGEVESIVEPTIEDAKKAFITAPNWASRSDRSKVKKFKDVNHYLSQPVNKIGETVFLTK